ncbi:MAG TPA: GDP-mannose 4,6-dehydratase [Thermoplasmata archaeon]|nr:GDP-mannose 4,6-dehydratase [Thermoplasmata archaeon]
MPNRSALITGITGQDGSYLAELLLSKGYRVYGLVRRLSSPNMTNIEQLRDSVEILDGDLIDQTSLIQSVRTAQPDEVYNLAAQSFVATSFSQPVLTGEITGLGTIRLLEAVRAAAPNARVYQASSSEMFGLVQEEPQNERTAFHPRSPYGVAKVYGYWASVNYREAYGMYVSNGILFNHESPRRGLEFVTRKIAHAVALIAHHREGKLTLGNLDAKRDWGYAPEFVDLMWRTLQHPRPDDFVGATGEAHSVREFVEEAFRVAGVPDWQQHVTTNDRYVRPSEVFNLRGDATKAHRELGWQPTTRFPGLVRIMVESEMARLDSPSR